MTVLDAAAIIAALTDEPGRAEVEQILADESSSNRVASVNVAEVIDVLLRTGHGTFDDVTSKFDALISASALEVLPLQDGTARRAGQLRAGHYDKRSRDVSMADCIAAATAEAFADSLATPDPHLTEMARQIGVEVIALPDSSGRRP